MFYCLFYNSSDKMCERRWNSSWVDHGMQSLQFCFRIWFSLRRFAVDSITYM